MQKYLSYPWQLRNILEQGLPEHKCTCVNYAQGGAVVIGSKVSAVCSVSGVKLARRIIWWRGDCYSLFEFPGPAENGDSSRNEKVHIEDEQQNNVAAVEVAYSSNAKNTGAACFDALLNAAYYLRSKVLKSDAARAPVQYLSDMLEQFLKYVDDDPARQASIVDLSHELPVHMEKITNQPKRALKRVREMERIQRVREIDKACLVNLARRPGITVAEKAGPRQRILAVRRQETCDTLENRVARHCCRLIRRSADHYLSFHYYVNTKDSHRKKEVEVFQRKAIKWAASEVFQGVAGLSVPCKSPNFALLQNPHYARIWKAYVTLVKNEEIRASVWRWQRQLWRDLAVVGFSKLVYQWIESLNAGVKIPVAQDCVVSGTRRFSQGRFINSDSLPGPYIIGESNGQTGTLYIVDNVGLERLYPQHANLPLMLADIYLIWEGETQRKVIPVYCQLFDLDLSAEESMKKGYSAVVNLVPFYPEFDGVLIIRPGLDNSELNASLAPVTRKWVWDVKLSINPSGWIFHDEFINSSPIKWLIR